MKISKFTVGIIIWSIVIIGYSIFLQGSCNKTGLSFFLCGPIFALLMLCGGILFLMGSLVYQIFFVKDKREKAKYSAVGRIVAVGLLGTFVVVVSKVFLGSSFMSSLVYGLVFGITLYIGGQIIKK